MTTVLGCIADDFTGATDIAGLLARSGVRVSLRIGVPEGPPRDTAVFEGIALKSRTAPVGEALAETRAALRWLQAAGALHLPWAAACAPPRPSAASARSSSSTSAVCHSLTAAA